MKLVLAVCEGEHDVAFVHRSARILGGFAPFERSIGSYPVPLGAGLSGSPPAAQFLTRRLQRQGLETAALEMATRPQLPALTGALRDKTGDVLLLTLRSHGFSHRQEVRTFLEDLFLTLDAVVSKEITSCATAFFVDADEDGCAARAEEVAASFGDLWGAATLIPGQWVTSPRGPLGVFVFCAPGATDGSLEDGLAPLMQSHLGSYWVAAEAFIDGHAAADAKVKRARRHRLKAVITAAGQFDRPGNPMSEMIRHDALPSAVFRTSPEAAKLVAFLEAVPW
ncbi:MAG TPA: hypothetical protein VL242_15145 [Sorangium sp.]|nr:hypothetical protein [Sorangium sp.]